MMQAYQVEQVVTQLKRIADVMEFWKRAQMTPAMMEAEDEYIKAARKEMDESIDYFKQAARALDPSNTYPNPED